MKRRRHGVAIERKLIAVQLAHIRNRRITGLLSLSEHLSARSGSVIELGV
jgi:hypothetical protein